MVLKTALPLLLLCLYAFNAQAHTRWSSPTARVDQGPPFGGVKNGPCGGGAHGDQGVVEFTAGEQVTLQLEETVHHPGVYQILFGTSEAELWDQNVLFVAANNPNHTQLGEDIPDPDGVDGVFDVTFQIPDEPCDKCILQGLQWMSGRDTYYFSCADIRIVAATTDDVGLSTPDMGSDQGNEQDASSPDSGTQSDGGNSPKMDLGNTPKTDAGRTDAGRPKDNVEGEGGCSSQPARPLPFVLLFALGLIELGRKRKRQT